MTGKTTRSTNGGHLPKAAKSQRPVFSQGVVGLRLRRARRVAGMSQSFLARKAGLHNTELSRIEKGRRNMSLQVFARLVDALDVDAQEILFGERAAL